MAVSHKNESKCTVNGHKGKFWFMYLKYFDPVKSSVIDYMHGVCLGTVKQLFTLWFDKKNKSNDFSFFHLRSQINDMLKTIKPAIFVTRIPRSIDEIQSWVKSIRKKWRPSFSLPRFAPHFSVVIDAQTRVIPLTWYKYTQAHDGSRGCVMTYFVVCKCFVSAIKTNG